VTVAQDTSDSCVDNNDNFDYEAEEEAALIAGDQNSGDDINFGEEFFDELLEQFGDADGEYDPLADADVDEQFSSTVGDENESGDEDLPNVGV
jgi:hypothetical protein